MVLRKALKFLRSTLFLLVLLPGLACSRFHDSDVFVVVNNRTSDLIEVFVNGKSKGVQSPGAVKYKVRVSTPTYDTGTGPNNSDAVTVYVTARNTRTNKSARTVTLQMLSDETQSVDFDTYDFLF